MSFMPDAMPQSTDFDTTQIDAKPQLPALDAVPLKFLTGVQDALTQSPVSDAIQKLYQAGTSRYNRGNFVSPEQVKSQYPYVDAPNGGFSGDLAETNNARRNLLLEQENKDAASLDNYGTMMQLAGGGAYLAGFGLPLAFDPLEKGFATAAGMGATKLGTAITDAATLGRKAEIATKLGINGITGSVDAIPITKSTYDYYKKAQVSMSPADMAYFLALGAGAKVLHTAYGLKRTNTMDARIASLQATQAQMDLGKRIMPEPILKDGAYRASTINPDVSAEEYSKMRSALSDGLDKSNKSLDAEQNKLDNMRSSLKNTLKSDKADLDTNNLLDKANKYVGINEDVIPKDDLALLKQMPNTPEFKSAIALSAKAEDKLNEHETTFLDRFKNGDEKELTKIGFEDDKAQIKELKNRIKSIKDRNDPEIQELKGKVKDLEEVNKGRKERISLLSKIDQEPKIFKKQREKVNKIKSQSRSYEKMIKDTDAYMQFKSTDLNPMTQADADAHAQKLQSVSSDRIYNGQIDSHGRFNNIADGLEGDGAPTSEEEKFLNEEVQSYKDNNELDDEQQKFLDDHEKEAKSLNETRNILDILKKCLARGGV